MLAGRYRVSIIYHTIDNVGFLYITYNFNMNPTISFISY